MTVAQLIATLKVYPPAAVVVMSSDGEGNSFSPLHVIENDTIALGFDIERLTNTERADLDGCPVIVLYPR